MPNPGTRFSQFASRLLLVLLIGTAACAGLPAQRAPVPANADSTSSAPTQAEDQLGTLTPTITAIHAGSQATGTPAYRCVPPKGEVTSGVVSRVIDGDSIEVRDAKEGVTYKVKYIGMRAPRDDPKKPEFFGEQATSKNRELVGGKPVILIKDTTDTDAYGYLLRYVFSGDTFVNLELVRLGYAFAWPTPPDVSCWETILKAESQSKGEQRGMWVMTPTPYRRGEVTPGAKKPTRTLVPTATSQGECDCRGPKLDCTNFKSQAEAQACYAYCVSKGWGDIFGLDPDQDGQVCQDLP